MNNSFKSIKDHESFRNKLLKDFTLFELSDKGILSFYIERIDYFIENFPYFKDIEIISEYFISNEEYGDIFFSKINMFVETLFYEDIRVEKLLKDFRISSILHKNEPTKIIKEFAKVMQHFFIKGRRVNKRTVNKILNRLLEKKVPKEENNDNFVYNWKLNNLISKIVIYNMQKVNLKFMFEEKRYGLVLRVIEILTGNDCEIEEESFLVEYEQIFIKEKLKHRMSMLRELIEGMGVYNCVCGGENDYVGESISKGNNTPTDAPKGNITPTATNTPIHTDTPIQTNTNIYNLQLLKILGYSFGGFSPLPGEIKEFTAFFKFFPMSPCNYNNLLLMRILSFFPQKNQQFLDFLVKNIFTHRGNSHFLGSVFRILRRLGYMNLRRLKVGDSPFLGKVMEYLVACASRIFSLQQVQDQLYPFLLKLYTAYQKSIEDDIETLCIHTATSYKTDVFCNSPPAEGKGDCRKILEALVEYEGGRTEEYMGIERYVILKMIEKIPVGSIFTTK